MRKYEVLGRDIDGNITEYGGVAARDSAHAIRIVARTYETLGETLFARRADVEIEPTFAQSFA